MDRPLIGAPFDETGEFIDAGAAYLFNGLTGQLLQTYHHPLPTSASRIGYSVALTDERKIMGAYYYNLPGAEQAGAVLSLPEPSSIVALFALLFVPRRLRIARQRGALIPTDGAG